MRRPPSIPDTKPLPTTLEKAGSGRSLSAQIWSAMACRLLLNTARRFAYPFAPALSRGLQVPLMQVTSLIAVNQFSALPALFSGPLADRIGYRRMILAGLICMAAGMLLSAFLPMYLVVMVGLLFAGLGKSIFDPAIQAYIGLNVPFEQRGRVVGIIELSWSGSALLGIPLAGLLMDRVHWTAPFWAMGLLGAFGAVWLAWMLPRHRLAGRPCESEGGGTKMRAAWASLLRQRPAIGLLGFSFWISVANDQVFVTYGAWMERAFDVGIVALGAGTALLGAAELCGEFLVAWMGDRFGLRRSVMGGTLLVIAGYACLPLVGSGLPLAWGGLFCIFLANEFSTVSGISLSTEAMPGLRATMMAAFYAAGGLGRMLGAFTGGLIWLRGGIWAVCLCAAGGALAALLCMAWGHGPTSSTKLKTQML